MHTLTDKLYGYSYGRPEVTESTLTLDELELLKRTVGAKQMMAECELSRCYDITPATVTTAQLVQRQLILEAVVAASLDVSSVLAEISSEHARILEMRSRLEGRRDRAVNLASIAILVVGSGIAEDSARTELSIPPGKLTDLRPAWRQDRNSQFPI